jgi:hypothetical protein
MRKKVTNLARSMIFWHPVVWITIPTIMGLLMGSVISAATVKHNIGDWSTLLSGLVWLSLFSAGLWGVLYNALTIWRLKVTETQHFIGSALAELTDDEYVELKEWIKMSTVEGQFSRMLGV